jgi:hypothetical protein
MAAPIERDDEDWTSSLTDDDLADVFGAPPAPSRVPLRIVDESWAPEPEPTVDDLLPSAEEMAEAQRIAGVFRIHEDTTQYPSFPWPTLAHLAGPMCPGDLVLVAARTGGGKSLLLQNLFDALIEAGRFGLYCGLEQSPEVLRIKWACMRAGVPPRIILAARPEERHTPAWEKAMADVQHWYAWQFAPPQKQRAFFSAERKIDQRRLRLWTAWAVDHGCDFVVIDHVDRMKHGDGRNLFHELSETIRLAKELAVEHRIVMLMATQVGRPSDALEQFMPPTLYNLRGAGTKEEEADTVLGVYRPLRADVTTAQLTDVRRGLANVDDIREPDAMGVMLLKHRLDGPVAGKAARLAVDRGVVYDPRHGQRCEACSVSLARGDVHPTLCTPCARGAR